MSFGRGTPTAVSWKLSTKPPESAPMPRPRKILPRYLSHPSGKARVVWTSPAGRREKMLPGGFNSPESLQAFARFQLELASSPEKPAPSLNGPTVVEVLAPYLRYAAEYHGPGSEWKAIKSALKTVRELYGADAVADFGPKKLAACREAFVRMGWSRPYINRQTQKIVRAFKWGVAEELAPANVLQPLRALVPLRLGHGPRRNPSRGCRRIRRTSPPPCPSSVPTSGPSSS